MAPSTNPYAAARRLQKAIALAAMIRALGGDSDSAAHLTDQEWIQLADAAEVNPPSDKTRALVIEILARDAAAKGRAA